MGIRILAGGTYDGEPSEKAVLVCSVSDCPFGPMFDTAEQAEHFLAWCMKRHGDPRREDLGTLLDFKSDWMAIAGFEKEDGTWVFDPTGELSEVE